MFDLWLNEGWMIYWNVVEKDFEILEKEWTCKMTEKRWEKVISWAKTDKKRHRLSLLLFLGVDLIFFVLMNHLKKKWYGLILWPIPSIPVPSILQGC